MYYWFTSNCHSTHANRPACANAFTSIDKTGSESICPQRWNTKEELRAEHSVNAQKNETHYLLTRHEVIPYLHTNEQLH